MSDAARLRAVFSASTEEAKQDILFLLDGSGSVNHDDFLFAKQIVAVLISAMGHNARISVAQFSAQCNIDVPFTAQRQDAERIVRNMRQYGSSTNTAGALQAAQCEYMARGREDASKVLFIFTDGHPDNQGAADRAAAALHQAAVNVIAVGIGPNVKRDGLTQMCGGRENCVFMIDNWSALSAVIPTRPTGHCVPDAEVLFRVTQQDRPTGINPRKATNLLRLTVTVRNMGNAAIKYRSKLSIDGGDFYEPESYTMTNDLPPNSQFDVDFTLTPSSNASLDKLPSSINLQLVSPQGVPYYSKVAGFELEFQHMSRDLIDWKPARGEPTANLLVFGWVGAGKSSLVSALMSLFLESLRAFAISSGQMTHVTTEVASFGAELLEQIDAKARVQFRFFDTWGLTGSNWRGTSLSMLRSGIRPAQMTMDTADQCDAMALAREYFNLHGTAPPPDEIHSVLLVFRQSARAEQEAMQRLKEIKEELVRGRLNPMLVITYGDELTPDEHQDVICEFAGLTGINRDRIFILDNSSEKKSFERDRTLYAILEMALNSANDFLITRKVPPQAVPQPAAVAPHVDLLSGAADGAAVPGAEDHLHQFLAPINMLQYYDSLSEEGFDTFHALVLLTSELLDDLGVKRGHKMAILRRREEIALHLQLQQ